MTDNCLILYVLLSSIIDASDLALLGHETRQIGERRFLKLSAVKQFHSALGAAQWTVAFFVNILESGGDVHFPTVLQEKTESWTSIVKGTPSCRELLSL